MNDRNHPDLLVEAVDAAGAETDLDQFEYRDGKSIFSIKVGDIDPSELRMRYNSTKLWVEVDPVSLGFLVPCYAESVMKQFDKVERNYLECHRELHWADCTADDLKTFIGGWFGSEERPQHIKDFHELTTLMVAPVIEGMIRQRDEKGTILSTEQFFDYLRLDHYESFVFTYCPYGFDPVGLRRYLSALPGCELDGSPIQPKAYQIHGYILMHLLSILRAHPAGAGKYRRERMLSAYTALPSMKAITSAKAQLNGNTLRVELSHDDSNFHILELSSVVQDLW
jgi:hypothetical protein